MRYDKTRCILWCYHLYVNLLRSNIRDSGCNPENCTHDETWRTVNTKYKTPQSSYAPKRRYISVACPWFGYEKSDTVQIMAQTNPQTQTPLFYHRHRNHIKQLKTHKSEVKCIHRQRPSHTTCIHFDAALSETLQSTFFLFISLRYERAC